MQVKNERPTGIRRGRVAGGHKQEVREMHSSLRDGGIEHVRFLVRWWRTPFEAHGGEKNQDGEKTLHARENTSRDTRSATASPLHVPRSQNLDGKHAKRQSEACSRFA